MRSACLCGIVLILGLILPSCSSTVRSLQPEEVRDSGAKDVLFYTTEGRVIGSEPDSCLLFSGPDSVQVLEIQGSEYTGPDRRASKSFHGQLTRSAVDSIQGRYKPAGEPAAYVLVGLVALVVTVGLLVQFHTISFKQ